MTISHNLPLYDFTGGMVTTIVSIVVTFAIIAALIFYIKKSKSNKKGMVHNKKMQNDEPDSQQ